MVNDKKNIYHKVNEQKGKAKAMFIGKSSYLEGLYGDTYKVNDKRRQSGRDTDEKGKERKGDGSKVLDQRILH